MGSQVEKYFWVIAVAAILFNVWLALRRYHRGGINFPQISPEEILYREYTASGRSDKSWLGAAAENCIKLVVTPAELWITSWFPFILVIGPLDIEHRIPKSKITKITLPQSFLSGSVKIDFLTESGTRRQLELWPRNRDKLIEALDLAGKVQVVKE
jgi:hypothetical protein